jgi:heme oxygenase
MYECYSFAAEKYVLNKLKEAGIDPFKTKMHFRLNKLRKEIEMRQTIENYIKQLYKQIAFLEDTMTITEGVHLKENTEVITLHTVIRDLEELGHAERRFSYWN